MRGYTESAEDGTHAKGIGPMKDLTPLLYKLAQGRELADLSACEEVR